MHLALTVLAFSYVEIVDDAYISFRYAHNLSEGEGLVFNPGEYVEGYTNLLWTLMMVLPEVLGFPPTDLFAAYLGLGFGILALIETWRICRLLGLSSWGTAAAVLVLGAYPHFWTTVTMGLEGGLFAFLLASSARLVLSGKPVWAGFLGGLMFATRPESALLLAAFALYAFFPSGDRIRRTLSLVFPWLAVVAVITGWRLFYYGAWLPNTIYAKSPPEYDVAVLLANASIGTEYLRGFAYFAAPLLLGAFIAPILAWRNSAVLLCLGAVAMEVPAIFLNGGDWMPNYRLLSVYAPLLSVLFGVSVDRLANRVPGREASATLAVLVACTGFLFLHSWDPWPKPWDQTPNVWDPTPDADVAVAEPCWQTLSDDAKPALLPSDVVALIEVLGVFSYENSGVYVHDGFGLADRHVALHGDQPRVLATFGKIDPSYTYHEIRPDLVLSKGGFFFLSQMAYASSGAYDEEYSTYELTDLSEACRERHMAAIRKEHVSRILPALADLNPQPVDVPQNPS